MWPPAQHSQPPRLPPGGFSLPSTHPAAPLGGHPPLGGSALPLPPLGSTPPWPAAQTPLQFAHGGAIQWLYQLPRQAPPVAPPPVAPAPQALPGCPYAIDAIDYAIAVPPPTPSTGASDFVEVRFKLLAIRERMEQLGLLDSATVAYSVKSKAELPRDLDDSDREEGGRGGDSVAGPKLEELSTVERLVRDAHLVSPKAAKLIAVSPEAKRTPPTALTALLSPSSKSLVSPGAKSLQTPNMKSLLTPGTKSPGGSGQGGRGAPPPSPPAGAAAGAFLLQLVKETDTPPKSGAEMGQDLLMKLQGKSATKAADTLGKKSAGSLLLESIQARKGTEDIDDGDDCILEAQRYMDRKWYVKVRGEWIVCTGKYYCIICGVSFDDLQEHLESDDHFHNRKLWEAANSRDQATSTEGKKEQEKHIASTTKTEVKEASRTAVAATSERAPEETQARAIAERYPDPLEEWLAWVPVDQGDPNGERRLRCLLCSKWTSGPAHSAAGGTGPGAEEHAKNVEKYVQTRSTWYVENVVSTKKRWSTALKPPSFEPTIPQATLPSASVAAALPAPASPAPRGPLPPPWQAAWSQEHWHFYYWNTATGAVQWAPPEMPNSR